MSHRLLPVLEKLCWVGVVVCGGMLAWEFADPPELVFPKVVDAGELAIEEPTHVRMTVTNRTGAEVRIVGGNFG